MRKSLLADQAAGHKAAIKKISIHNALARGLASSHSAGPRIKRGWQLVTTAGTKTVLCLDGKFNLTPALLASVPSLGSDRRSGTALDDRRPPDKEANQPRFCRRVPAPSFYDLIRIVANGHIPSLSHTARGNRG
jgi:hypothetical protein